MLKVWSYRLQIRMKITFIYPDLNLGKFNLGVGYLSSVLKRNDHQTSLIHLKDYINQDTFRDILREKSPDLVAISSCTNMMSYAANLAHWSKKLFKDMPVICGGVHPTLCPEEVIAVDDIDMICLGEGEESLLELCDNLEDGKDITSIDGIWVKEKSTIHKNPIRSLVRDLDSLPFADRGIFSRDALFEDGFLDAGFVMVSRGCPYNCSYCCNQAFHQLYKDKGSYLRFRSVNNVIEEIKSLVNKYGFKTIIFHDDIMPLEKEWLRNFAQEYKLKINLPFICNMRVELADKESLGLLKSAGCSQICLGIESGNDFIRNKVMRRAMSKKQIIEAFSLCRDLGIKRKSFNMVGSPSEDMSKILETIKLNVKINPDIIQVSIFYPYPGTELFDYCRTNNLITNKDLVSYFDGSILSLPAMSQEQIYFARKRFVRMFKRYKFFKKLPIFIRVILEKVSDFLFRQPLSARMYVLQRNISQAIKARGKKKRI